MHDTWLILIGTREAPWLSGWIIVVNWLLLPAFNYGRDTLRMNV